MTSPDLPKLCERLEEEEMGVHVDAEAPVIGPPSGPNISAAFLEGWEPDPAPLYYARGDGTVFRRPITQPKVGGGSRVSMGFPVCKVSEFSDDDAADMVAAALNAHDTETPRGFVRSEATITAASPASGMNENPTSPSPPRVGRG